MYQRMLLLAILMAIIGLNHGCQKPVESPNSQSTGKQSTEDDLDEALDYIDSLDDFDITQLRELMVYYLNRWIATKSGDDQWNRSSLIDGLPQDLRRIRFVVNVQENKYLYIDVSHIHQCCWHRDISNWVSRLTDAPHLQYWNKAIPDSMEPQHRAKLVLAIKLFDWTIRNIQLDPLPDHSQEDLDQSWDLAYKGTVGAGYTLNPQEVVLFGHGDAWQRARLFILLARQQKIDAVMLAIQRTDDGQPIPWLPAVMLNDQLYLFDTQLGLPIPIPGQGQLATLQQVRKDPTILTRLAVGEGQAYRVQPADLPHVIALIDASPFALSQRMLMLQKQLTGRQQMVLTVMPDRMGKKLRDKHGVNSTKLWNVPLETLLYAQSRGQRKEIAGPGSKTAETRYPMQSELFRPDLKNPLVTARQRYVRGQFNSRALEKGQPETTGAKPLLMAGRRTEKEIAGIKTIAKLQEALKLEQRRDESTEEWKQRLDDAQRYYSAIKQYASYWLGIIQFEEGNYEIAISWLNHTLADGPANPFFQGAHYNLGRCYEALGQIEQASQMYQFADSPQQTGNQLRLQLLISGKASPSPATPQDPAP